MTVRLLGLLLGLSLISGCGAITALNGASAELDAYTLSPLPVVETPNRNLHLVVALPTSSGALATDRILIKPSPTQAQYLPDGRWTDTTPVLVQTLLVASLQNAGGFLLVDRDGSGLLPDHTLMTELHDFQAEPSGAEVVAVTVRVSATMTLIRESDLTIFATRRVAASSVAADDSTAALIAAFDRAMAEMNGTVVTWLRETLR